MKKPQRVKPRASVPRKKNKGGAGTCLLEYLDWSFTYAIDCSLLFIIFTLSLISPIITAVLEPPIASNPLTFINRCLPEDNTH